MQCLSIECWQRQQQQNILVTLPRKAQQSSTPLFGNAIHMDATTELIEFKWSKDQKCKLTAFNKIGAWVERAKRTLCTHMHTYPKLNQIRRHHFIDCWWSATKFVEFFHYIDFISPLYLAHGRSAKRKFIAHLYQQIPISDPYVPAINGYGFIGNILHTHEIIFNKIL